MNSRAIPGGPTDFLASYLVYLGLFVGTGFTSGAIVHYPMGPARFLLIGAFGAAIFVLATTANELRLTGRKPARAAFVRLVLVSLLLAIGIGMVSGGVQHFSEYPVYASRLIPIGALVSLTAFAAKSRPALTRKGAALTTASACAAAGLLGLVLHGVARGLPEGAHDDGHAASSGAAVAGPDTAAEERKFLSHMVPHHRDAVDASRVVAARTANPRVKAFAERIVAAQVAEIATMAEWHEKWFGMPLVVDAGYASMMSDYRSAPLAGIDDAYLSEMIAHHRTAVATAQRILGLTARSELRELASAIVRTQSAEIDEMRSLASGPSIDPGGHAGH